MSGRIEPMPQSAALLLDLQVDFLALTGARMPVAPDDAERVIAAANAVLAGTTLPGCLPVLIVNRFPVSALVANFFRRGAAIEGSTGAAVDPRIRGAENVRVFAKQHPSAFTNVELEPFLRGHGVSKVYVLGVFAEGCVRATATEARRRGFEVEVPLDGMGTNGEFKRRFAQWAMRRAGVTLRPSLPHAEHET